MVSFLDNFTAAPAPAAADPLAVGRAARAAYIAQCEAAGREYDPITADDEYQRAKCRAEGRTYYAGD